MSALINTPLPRAELTGIAVISTPRNAPRPGCRLRVSADRARSHFAGRPTKMTTCLRPSAPALPVSRSEFRTCSSRAGGTYCRVRQSRMRFASCRPSAPLQNEFGLKVAQKLVGIYAGDAEALTTNVRDLFLKPVASWGYACTISLIDDRKRSF